MKKRFKILLKCPNIIVVPYGYGQYNFQCNFQWKIYRQVWEGVGVLVSRGEFLFFEINGFSFEIWHIDHEVLICSLVFRLVFGTTECVFANLLLQALERHNGYRSGELP
jgi:hypothetical protein